MSTDWAPLFPAAVLTRLRYALQAHYSSEAVNEALGLAGSAALARGDLLGVERLTRQGSATEAWIRLFLLGQPISESEAVRALAPLGLPDAIGCGLLTSAQAGGAATVRAALDLRPYSEDGGPDWWILSDLGAELRVGPLDPEHVLGIGAAATTLAQATIRGPVSNALDLGTGSGVQALHLSRHAERVVATDLSPRALRMAATTAALNGLSWDLRQGSLLQPVAGEQFDQIVCNPPFIVGPGFTAESGGFTYRDSGLAGDAVCRELVTGLPARLTPGGTAQLLANWTIDATQDWAERLTGWLQGSGCDAWVWQREVAEPGEYISLWLRDAGEQPGSERWRARYERWRNWFDEAGVLAVGMGLVNLRQMHSSRPVVICEDVPQPIEQPAGPAVASWFERLDYLRALGPAGLATERLRPALDLVLDERSLLGPDGWQPGFTQLRQSGGMRWEVEADSAVAGLVAALSAGLALQPAFELISQLLDLPSDDVAAALTPVVEDLLRRGVLLPPRRS
ncbi:MAG: methyltransferase [Frankiales bacterium]|nr:methyltransferase [Frankiales bacterium]